MKRTAIFLITMMFYTAIRAQAVCEGQQVTLVEDGMCNYDPYTLVFEDNFDGNTLDLTKWEPVTGVPRDFEFVFQRAWHLPENLQVSDGTLKITAKKLSTPYSGTWVSSWATNPPTTQTSDFYYTTGELWTKYQFGHGKFEIRCKIPKGKGFFPAFWTFAGQPYNEIDVFEFWNESTLGNYDADKLSKIHKMNAHYDYDGDGKSENCPTSYKGPDYSQAFHTFTLIWTPYKMAWYVDGDLKRTSTLYYSMLGQTVDCNGVQAFQPYILDKAFPKNPMQIIANLAIQSGDNAPDDNTPFPSALEIDYIRYYRQVPCRGSIAITGRVAINLDPEIYNVLMGTKIKVSDNFTIKSDEQLAIIARDEIEFNPGFAAEENSNFVARIDEGICFDIDKMVIKTDSMEHKNPGELLQRKSGVNDTLVVTEGNDYTLKIFPNPNEGRFLIEFSPQSNFKEIYIFDMQGKKLFSQKRTENHQIEIDINEYEAGTYLLFVVDEDGRINTHKIIKS